MASCKNVETQQLLSLQYLLSFLFWVLQMSIATDTKVFVVIMFDRAARVLFGCSADEFFDFAKIHPYAGISFFLVCISILCNIFEIKLLLHCFYMKADNSDLGK